MQSLNFDMCAHLIKKLEGVSKYICALLMYFLLNLSCTCPHVSLMLLSLHLARWVFTRRQDDLDHISEETSIPRRALFSDSTSVKWYNEPKLITDKGKNSLFKNRLANYVRALLIVMDKVGISIEYV